MITPAAQERTIDFDGPPPPSRGGGDAGPPLVLLHGVGDNALDWRWVMPALAHDHRVYAPDLPGSGGNIKPAADHYSSAFFQRFVGSFMDALGAERTAVVGNSAGGLIALRMALARTERGAGFGRMDGWVLGRAESSGRRGLR